jgi:hypothetical protein
MELVQVQVVLVLVV